MAVTMPDARQWLTTLRDHHDNHQWLFEHVEPMYEVLRRGLSVDHEVHAAIDALILISPYTLGLFQQRRWNDLLYNALTEAQHIGDRQRQAQISIHIGNSHVLLGQHYPAQTAFQLALEHAHWTLARVDKVWAHEVKVSANTGLLRVQALHQSSFLDTELIDQTVMLANAVDSPRLQAALHQTLALMYTRRDQIDSALKHGKTALDLWENIGNNAELARTAFTLALAHRVADHLEGSDATSSDAASSGDTETSNASRPHLQQADQYMQLAQSRLSVSEFSYIAALNTYEEGVRSHRVGQAAHAVKLLNAALAQFIRLEQTHHVAMARHALGLAQIDVPDFEAARSNLQAAWQMWYELGSYLEQGETLYGLAYLEMEMGSHEATRKWLNQALLTIIEAPNTYVRDDLQARIHTALKHLDESQ